MNLSDFDFELPEDLIALRPASPRRASRLLVSSADGMRDSAMSDLAAELRPGDLLVFNNTQVIPARLFGTRTRDGSVVDCEATLLERLDARTWRALAKPGRRLKPGDRIVFSAAETGSEPDLSLAAELTAKGEGGAVDLRFEQSGPELDSAIARIGSMPLPPYIAARRAADMQDREDYQTIFARRPGAVAAPTAALHFDDELMASLADRGVGHVEVTLHVGAGTFLPVKSDNVDDHVMHAEYGEVSPEAAHRIAETRAAGGRIIAVGTTSLRILETAAQETGAVKPFRGETRLFLKPGSQIHAVDGLVTNFHLPRSTLLMLVGALISLNRTRELYFHAVRERYRFYSYGDASLLWP